MRALVFVLAAACCTLTCAQQGQLQFDRPWDDWEPPVLPAPEPNAYDLYRTAFDLLKDFEPPGDDATQQELRDSIAGLGLAYYWLQQAMMGECRFPPATAPDQSFPELAAARNACRFMVTHAQVAALDGDMARAALDCIACVRIGAAAASNGTLVGGLVAAACEAIGLRQLAEITSALQPAECRLAIAALRQAQARRVSLAEVLRGELICGKITMKRLFADMKTPEDIERTIAALAPEQRAQALEQWQQLQQTGQLWTPASCWRTHEEWLQQLIAEAEKPYWQRETPPLPADPVVELLAGLYPKTQVRFALGDAQLSLALCRLAAQGYLLEHGGLPENLAALVPEWLPSVPADPFRNAPLSSAIIEGRFVIYSVGPDMVDDGGRPTEGFPQGDSLGDIVASL